MVSTNMPRIWVLYVAAWDEQSNMMCVVLCVVEEEECGGVSNISALCDCHLQ